MRTTIEVPVGLFLEVMGMLPQPDVRHTLPIEQQSTLRKLEKYEALARLPKLHIEGRRWFSKGPGTTYHKVRIYENGNLIHTSDQSNGYDQQYLYTALYWLAEHRPDLVPEWERNQNVTIYLREVIGATYDVTDVAREKDL